MALTRETWPDRAAVQASLAARFALPPFPAALQDWFDWCRRTAGQSLWLQALTEGGAGDGTLTGLRTVDGPGLLAAMEGYRFILDVQASTPGDLVWTDAVQSGQWQPQWVVLQQAGGDPLIGDLREAQVPVLWDEHGGGGWSPQPLYGGVAELMAAIEPHDPPTEGEGPPTPFYTVVLVDLGPEPLRVLTALKAHARYADLAGARLLQLKRQLPISVLEDCISESLRDHWVQALEAVGGRVQVTQRVLGRRSI